LRDEVDFPYLVDLLILDLDRLFPCQVVLNLVDPFLCLVEVLLCPCQAVALDHLVPSFLVEACFMVAHLYLDAAYFIVDLEVFIHL
jgi:hypothetical protein